MKGVIRGAVGLGLSLSLTAVSLAQDAAEAESPVDSVLRQWADASSKIELLEADFHVFQYDTVFFVENRGTGRLVIQPPNRACLEIRPATIPADAISRRLDAHRRPYALGSLRHDHWVWDGTTVYWIDQEAKRFDAFEMEELRRPTANAGFFERLKFVLHLAWFFSPILMEANLDSADLNRRFEWEISKDEASGIVLVGVPKMREIAQQISTVTVMLDPVTFQKRAIRYIDPSGQVESVYVLQNLRINEPRAADAPDPFAPNLEGFKGSVVRRSQTPH